MASLEPKQIEVKTLKGDLKSYWISKFPAIAGREIVAGYPLTAMPKIGEYKANEEIMLKLMCYVGAEVAPGNIQWFTTRAMVDNHVPDYETLVKLELESMRYNTSFFGKGEVSSFLADTAKKVLVSTSPMLIPLLRQLSAAVKRP